MIAAALLDAIGGKGLTLLLTLLPFPPLFLAAAKRTSFLFPYFLRLFPFPSPLVVAPLIATHNISLTLTRVLTPVPFPSPLLLLAPTHVNAIKRISLLFALFLAPLPFSFPLAHVPIVASYCATLERPALLISRVVPLPFSSPLVLTLLVSRSGTALPLNLTLLLASLLVSSPLVPAPLMARQCATLE
ncbi:hypothetical protein AB1Y20_015711 [Prymnesium parvum]|uniref:Uncharacterized protein n=1 Tax=Prymnesium parvum TaxID=97485 RepID=A0AB34JXI9_PRYPA